MRGGIGIGSVGQTDQQGQRVRLIDLQLKTLLGKHADRFGGGCARRDKLSAVLFIVVYVVHVSERQNPGSQESKGA